jgi:predicted transposase/invertase (TIGR01784 family)
MDTGIQRAQERMDFVLMDPEAYREYELREAQITFYDQDAKEIAREAARNNSLEIARNLKARGISIEDIIGSTNLSPEDLEKL